MPAGSYQIRICDTCGLRYPLVDPRSARTRCPACLGHTRVVLSRRMIAEAGTPHSEEFRAADTWSGRQDRRNEVRGELAVLLDNIRSAWNVGSIFRTADGFGFGHAYLCGITPTPGNEAVRKTSLGAERSLSWSYHKNAVELVSGLKYKESRILALEAGEERAVSFTCASSERLQRDHAAERKVLIMGNEVTGIDPELVDLSDVIFFIPMYGQKHSFNVAIAFGIAAYVLSSR